MCFAQHSTIWDISRILYSPPVVGPAITVQYPSLTGFSNVAGNASTEQTDIITFSNLAASTGATTTVTGYEQSINGTVWAANFTGIANGTYTLHVRIAAATGAGTQTGTITVSGTGATSKTIGLNGTTTAPPANTAKWAFRLTDSTVAGWNVFTGDPTTGISKTDATTGWQLATNGSDWSKFFSLYATDHEGGTDSSNVYVSPFLGPSMYGTWLQGTFKFADMTDGLYPFQVNNLAAGSYTVQIMCAQRSAIQNTQGNNTWVGNIHIKFGSSSALPTTESPINIRNNTTNIISFTGTITAGDKIRFGPFLYYDGAFTHPSLINAVIITLN